MMASALHHALMELFGFVTEQGIALPTRDVRFVEIGPAAAMDARGRPIVRRADFYEAPVYAPRFDELLTSSLPWLNVNCCGLDRDRLIVVVELPQPRTDGAAVTRVSINYSGPTRAVLEHGWDAGEALLIT